MQCTCPGLLEGSKAGGHRWVGSPGHPGFRAYRGRPGTQFDEDDPKQEKQKSAFFNWFYWSINLGALVRATPPRLLPASLSPGKAGPRLPAGLPFSTKRRKKNEETSVAWSLQPWPGFGQSLVVRSQAATLGALAESADMGILGCKKVLDIFDFTHSPECTCPGECVLSCVHAVLCVHCPVYCYHRRNLVRGKSEESRSRSGPSRYLRSGGGLPTVVAVVSGQIATTGVVNVQAQVSWTIGYIIPAVCFFLAFSSFLFGTPWYRCVTLPPSLPFKPPLLSKGMRLLGHTLSHPKDAMYTSISELRTRWCGAAQFACGQSCRQKRAEQIPLCSAS